jgi:16S rRNA (cytosine1402-N4)-methyltransferase
MFRHTPVLAEQVIQFLNPRPGGFFIDATVGAGGHSRAILELTAPDGKLLAIDQDESALTQAGQELAVFGPRVVFVHANFRDVAQVAAAHGFSGCDGVLADIGISSMMVDDPSRGFSFMREGPLDMRMDRTQPLTAAEVLNTFSEKDIAGILFHYGEERRSRTIARSIVRGRPLQSTADLVRAIERVTGGPRYGRIHPATRTFQALRIFVTDELKNLGIFLDSSMAIVGSRGRIVVITFHSLEDRIVKQKFREPAVAGSVLTRKVVVANEKERQHNPRSRSAKLRAWERS